MPSNRDKTTTRLLGPSVNLPLLSALILVIAIGVAALVYATRPWPNGAWTAADHNRDGIVTRDEMDLFGSQEAHRDRDRLLTHFDGADVNHDRKVDLAEIKVYGTEIGSRDPANRGK